MSLNHDIGLQQVPPEFRNSLKEHAAVVLGDARSATELETGLPNVAAQVVKDVNKVLKDQGSSELAVETKNLICAEISALRDPGNRVMGLIRKPLRQKFHHYEN